MLGSAQGLEEPALDSSRDRVTGAAVSHARIIQGGKSSRSLREGFLTQAKMPSGSERRETAPGVAHMPCKREPRVCALALYGQELALPILTSHGLSGVAGALHDLSGTSRALHSL